MRLVDSKNVTLAEAYSNKGRISLLVDFWNIVTKAITYEYDIPIFRQQEYIQLNI